MLQAFPYLVVFDVSHPRDGSQQEFTLAQEAY